ncbi:MAG: protein-export membrane protein SecF [Chloroflexi bacterium GWB2_49_20]|nr:MAG: protein-export membrane protein SecF [Chloroflexi bacterium GWB2_49_20]OGN76863.1 MAG: protein-export membrane protein SecF [Chloroflexi bacterium GWC2_49_37]OGN84383.1 MAG: protein-export membrane protein SecF [Chloroflexi bacterium GWD2_49_16]HCC78230.1 protein translocase subunit SecF [Anaerolineae bacterium]HCM96736.1 protein translocase subunit SecF [Anaerolineae bacterium]
MNIIKNRYLYFGISLLVIIPGIIALLLWHLPLGIDFTGGSLLEVKFETGAPLSSDQVTNMYADFSKSGSDISNPVIQPLGTDSLSIRSKVMTDATKSEIVAAMQELSGSTVTVLHFTQVSAAVGQEVATRAAGAVALAAVVILLYITYAFRGVQHAFRYGTAAIIAMLHDVLVVIGFEAILGHYLGWEADSLFLTALLTVIGFSVHDTIVVFDRIRENSNHYKKIGYETLVNHSIVQTLDRSINTQLTVMMTLLALTLFGGNTIRHFVVILLVGVFSGTYSSIFNAAPILVVWENKEWRTWFKRKPAAAQ